MTIKELIKRLKAAEKLDDIESAHIAADQSLLDFINNTEVTQAFEAIEKWYA